jgi:hypothetical protein
MDSNKHTKQPEEERVREKIRDRRKGESIYNLKLATMNHKLCVCVSLPLSRGARQYHIRNSGTGSAWG